MWSAAKGFLRLLPLLLMALTVAWLLLSGQDISIEALLERAPDGGVPAALFLWLAFAVKSMSLMVPVLLIFAVTGIIFPLPLALLINAVGISITLTIPYLIGRFSGPDLSARLMEKHPRLYEFRDMRSRNGFFFAFIVRAVGILPCDVVSLYLGNTRMPYDQYICGGVLGFLPDLVCATVVGMKLSDTSSPWFWLSIGINITLCIASFFLYRAYRRKQVKK